MPGENLFSSVFTKEPVYNIPSVKMRSQTKIETAKLTAVSVEIKSKNLKHKHVFLVKSEVNHSPYSWTNHFGEEISQENGSQQ